MHCTIEPYHFPLRQPFVTSGWTLTSREILLFSITDETRAVTGWGESAPLPAFGTEDLARSRAALDAARQTLAAMTEIPAPDALRLTEWIPALTHAPAARFAVECALLDAYARGRNMTLRALLAEGEDFRPVDRVPVNAVIGALSLEDTAAAAARACEHGFSCLKLKVGSGPIEDDIARIRAVIMAVPEGIRLRLDANGAWDFAEAELALHEFAIYDVEYVEQPVPAADIDEFSALTALGIIPLAADESAQDLAQARTLLAREAVDLFVLKPMAAGSLRDARRFAIDAHARGRETVFTSLIDSSIARHAVAQLCASLPFPMRPQGLATGLSFERDTHRDRLEDGYFLLSGEPGLGIDPSR
ncbi:MAG: o-succinylbenzoate synthase [Bacteroidota bacterium]|jgi:o-succinylbenzoate synthase|nr:o-succinylbenzoate synthase [Bacteroidota bacterium]